MLIFQAAELTESLCDGFNYSILAENSPKKKRVSYYYAHGELSLITRAEVKRQSKHCHRAATTPSHRKLTLKSAHTERGWLR